MAIESQELTVKEVVNPFTGKQTVGDITTTVSFDGYALLSAVGTDCKIEFEDGSYVVVDETLTAIETQMDSDATVHMEVSVEEIRRPDAGKAFFSSAETYVVVIESAPETIVTSEGAKGLIILPNGIELLTTENQAALAALVGVDHVDVTIKEMQSETIGKRTYTTALTAAIITQGASGLELYAQGSDDSVLLLKKSGIRILMDETYTAVAALL